ncbi:ATPase of the AAA class, partial [Coemansia sp. RSA 2703]
VGKRLLLTNIAQHLGIPLTRIHLARILASGNRYTALSRMLSHAGDRPTLVWLADAELFRGLGCHVVEGFLDRVRGMPGCVVVLSTRYADRVAVGLRSRVDDHVELAASGDRGKRFRLCRWFAQGSLDHRVIEDVAGQTLGRTAAETFALLADLAERRGTNFIAVAIPDLVKGEVGASEKALASVFAQARLRPSVVFLDEIEAIFGNRKDAGEVGKKLVSQLFLEIDAVPEDAHLVVLAATNAPELLDEAILRPGRLDKIIHVPRPGYEGRREILQRAVGHLEVEGRDLLVDRLAEREMSGAEIKALVRAACYSAVERGSNVLTASDFDTAVAATHFQAPSL